jgi:hypothetical protein
MGENRNAESIPHKTRQHNNNDRHPGYKKEDKFMTKKQITHMNLDNNRGIGRKDAWSAIATATKLNTAYDIFKLKRN